MIEPSATILAMFLVFCRVGSCLMLLPGYSNIRVPVQVRLFIAVALSLAVSPGLLPGITPIVATAGDDTRLQSFDSSRRF